MKTRVLKMKLVGKVGSITSEQKFSSKCPHVHMCTDRQTDARHPVYLQLTYILSLLKSSALGTIDLS